MSKDLIQALEGAVKLAEKSDKLDRHRLFGRAIEPFIEAILSRHRSSVESVELPEPLFYYRPTCSGEMYEGPHHAKSVGGRMLREEKPGEWVGLIDATTVRSLIAAAVEREREAIIQMMPGGHSVDPQLVCDAIRARGEKP